MMSHPRPQHPSDDTSRYPAEGAGGDSLSLVGGCAAMACRYNAAYQCRAGAINVAFVDGVAQCATFALRDDNAAAAADEKAPPVPLR